MQYPLSMDSSGFILADNISQNRYMLTDFRQASFFQFKEYREEQLPVFTEEANNGSPFDCGRLGRDLSTEFLMHLTELSRWLSWEHPEHDPSANLAMGMTILTKSNIQTFIRLYFHHWNRHSPVVHRGTFDVNKSPLPLLLVITLTGALFSVSERCYHCSEHA